MSNDVAALPFQAHANYGTWSIDFGCIKQQIDKYLPISIRWTFTLWELGYCFILFINTAFVLRNLGKNSTKQRADCVI